MYIYNYFFFTNMVHEFNILSIGNLFSDEYFLFIYKKVENKLYKSILKTYKCKISNSDQEKCVLNVPIEMKLNIYEISKSFGCYKVNNFFLKIYR